jgi:NAD(P)-dependent dehydrogenase (short-subunit alcohol dehydrogenase family)
MRLKGKTAVITGGASGMGRSTVLRFLHEGANVVIADFNATTGAETMQLAAAQGHGAQAYFIKTDVAKEADIEAMLACACDIFGSLDIVFNNAGVGGAIGPITETTVEAWDYTFDVLAKSVFLGMKHAARIMKKRGQGGSIINTASIAGLSGDAGPIVYSAAKAAVISLTKSAAVELAPDLIRVNAICPGFIVTPLTHRGRVEQTAAMATQSQPWPEAGQGEHIAGAALFLASDDARFVTGEALIVDGGLTAAGPEISKRLKSVGGATTTYSGITRGSTGEAPTLRKLGE